MKIHSYVTAFVAFSVLATCIAALPTEQSQSDDPSIGSPSAEGNPKSFYFSSPKPNQGLNMEEADKKEDTLNKMKEPQPHESR
ncbi:hypothetical protein IWQ62_004467, partial [Dispira parvispora]